jgi:hypothetical protein
VGVVLHCPQQAFLGLQVHVDEARLRSLWPELDVALVRERLAAFPKVCAGEDGAGPIAKLSRRERFHWLVAPRSTIVQVSPTHSGLCESAPETLDALFARLVLF